MTRFSFCILYCMVPLHWTACFNCHVTKSCCCPVIHVQTCYCVCCLKNAELTPLPNVYKHKNKKGLRLRKWPTFDFLNPMIGDGSNWLTDVKWEIQLLQHVIILQPLLCLGSYLRGTIHGDSLSGATLKWVKIIVVVSPLACFECKIGHTFFFQWAGCLPW